MLLHLNTSVVHDTFLFISGYVQVLHTSVHFCQDMKNNVSKCAKQTVDTSSEVFRLYPNFYYSKEEGCCNVCTDAALTSCGKEPVYELNYN